MRLRKYCTTLPQIGKPLATTILYTQVIQFVGVWLVGQSILLYMLISIMTPKREAQTIYACASRCILMHGGTPLA